ncbi:unnamed protein product [Triticum turgidum subsp. durum]|uniref:Uncharacterized protein n=1 Tax=Triticum turgidum subsp. durum TaxID=4567 RepID=A0A9R0S8P4_TRITD|nr:unnamed protein product [Triticum turgidum subsp. durum]
MEPNADKLRGLRITSLDDEDDDETELPATVAAAASGYDDDDEDEDEEAEVMLGFLEKPKHPGLLRHLFPSKAGGIPAWLDPMNLPSGNSSCCGFCGEPLHFVLQVIALCLEAIVPVVFFPELVLVKWMLRLCRFMLLLRAMQQHSTALSSCSCARRWHACTETSTNSGHATKAILVEGEVFRCQLPRTNVFYSSEPPSHNNSDKPLCAGGSFPFCSVTCHLRFTVPNKFGMLLVLHFLHYVVLPPSQNKCLSSSTKLRHLFRDGGSN